MLALVFTMAMFSITPETLSGHYYLLIQPMVSELSPKYSGSPESKNNSDFLRREVLKHFGQVPAFVCKFCDDMPGTAASKYRPKTVQITPLSADLTLDRVFHLSILCWQRE